MKENTNIKFAVFGKQTSLSQESNDFLDFETVQEVQVIQDRSTQSLQQLELTSDDEVLEVIDKSGYKE